MTEQEFYAWLGSKIREFRKLAKMSQEDICIKTGVYQTDLSKFEKRGERIRSAYTISSILEATGHTLADLYTDGKKKRKLTLTLRESQRTPLNA